MESISGGVRIRLPRWQRWSRGTHGTARAQSLVVDSQTEELGRIRSHFLREAVLWVFELAEHDRFEAHHAADELRRYFESVLNSLPADEQRELSEQIQDVCHQLDGYEKFSHS